MSLLTITPLMQLKHFGCLLNTYLYLANIFFSYVNSNAIQQGSPNQATSLPWFQ
jgi:hypothetical protein